MAQAALHDQGAKPIKTEHYEDLRRAERAHENVLYLSGVNYDYPQYDYQEEDS